MDCTLNEIRRYNADPLNVGTTQTISLVIDGRTLNMLLAPDLQDSFIEVVKHCRSVLCCRVTPLQKSAVVKVIREKLKVMTLAVGKRAATHIAYKVGNITDVPGIIGMGFFPHTNDLKNKPQKQTKQTKNTNELLLILLCQTQSGKEFRST